MPNRGMPSREYLSLSFRFWGLLSMSVTTCFYNMTYIPERRFQWQDLRSRQCPTTRIYFTCCPFTVTNLYCVRANNFQRRKITETPYRDYSKKEGIHMNTSYYMANLVCRRSMNARAGATSHCYT